VITEFGALSAWRSGAMSSDEKVCLLGSAGIGSGARRRTLAALNHALNAARNRAVSRGYISIPLLMLLLQPSHESIALPRDTPIEAIVNRSANSADTSDAEVITPDAQEHNVGRSNPHASAGENPSTNAASLPRATISRSGAVKLFVPLGAPRSLTPSPAGEGRERIAHEALPADPANSHAATTETRDSGTANSTTPIHPSSPSSPLTPAPSPTWAEGSESGYHLPPQKVLNLIDLQPIPNVVLSPNRRWMVLEVNAPASLHDMSRPLISLAGVTVDPVIANWQPIADGTRLTAKQNLTLVRVSDGATFPVKNLPRSRVSGILWAADSRHFVFLQSTDTGPVLWVASTARAEAWPLHGPPVNEAAPSIVGTVPGGFRSCTWMPDNVRLLCLTVPRNRAAPPSKKISPDTRDTRATQQGVSRFDADLLSSSFDELLFEYYATSQAQLINISTGERKDLGSLSVYNRLIPSPDGMYLLSERKLRPYSRRVMHWLFARSVDVLDRQGTLVRHIGVIPEAARRTNVGESRGVIDSGMRSLGWQPGANANLVYAEALGDDSGVTPEYRDRIMLLESPFKDAPREIMRTRNIIDTAANFRTVGRWTDDGRAVVREWNADESVENVWLLDLRRPSPTKSRLWTKRIQTVDVGRIDSEQLVGTITEKNEQVLLRDGDWIYFSGSDHPEGAQEANLAERIFLDRFNLVTHRRQRLFHSEGPNFQAFIAVVDSRAREIITTFETPASPPEYLVRSLKTHSHRRISIFEDTTAQRYYRPFEGKRHVLRYIRADGVRLEADLFLPPNYHKGNPVSVIVLSYPHVLPEFARSTVHRTTVVRVLSSPYAFSGYTGDDSLYDLIRSLTALDYGVMYADMPLIGGAKAYESFVEQTDANASAAVQALLHHGISRRGRIAIAGGSLGGTVAASVLTSSELFSAGASIAGVYQANRNPFGFILESRNYWDALVSYHQISPWEHANKLHAPLLIIHGARDINFNTPPAAARAMYDALDGLGKPARLVILPGEGHSPTVARESKLHVIAEMITWFGEYLRPVETRSITSERLN
jgi:dipeptidyl aminopeptidase/acylaminoacyl peptidase